MLLLVRKEKFLTIFLSYCLLSIFWSGFKFVLFKRLFQVLTSVTVCTAFLLHVRSTKSILKFFKYILTLYIPLSLISILLFPGATDPETMTWRGLAPSKNHLGQASLISTVAWVGTFSYGNLKEKFLSLIMMVLSLVLLMGSMSMTSILALFIMAVMAAIFWFNTRFRSLNVGHTFVLLTAIFSLLTAITTFILEPNLYHRITDYLGKDVTFTGRIELWADIFNEARKHLAIGCGFASFWVIENVDLLNLYADYTWFPNQAHMGYLDLLNETGLVGLFLFCLMIVFYFVTLANQNQSHFWKWFMVCSLLINFQETTLFRQNVLTGVMFIFSYLALYIEVICPRIPETEPAGSNTMKA